MALQVLFGYAERIDADINAALTIGEGGGDIAVNLIHSGTSDCVAIYRLAFIVDHHIGTRIILNLVVIIWEADINGPIILAVEFQMAYVNAVKAFWNFK